MRPPGRKKGFFFSNGRREPRGVTLVTELRAAGATPIQSRRSTISWAIKKAEMWENALGFS